MEKMPYVKLGNTGLKVSRLSYGNWVTGGSDAQERSNTLLKAAFEHGVNFFDTAEGYAAGEAEKQFGISLKTLNVPRSDYVVSTKIFWGKQSTNVNTQNASGTSRKRIIEGLDRSLKHLDLTYVDVVFLHRFDHTTPVEEVCHAMKTVIDSGRALYWATSEWPAVRIMEAIHISDKIGGYRPVADQCQYNMLERKKLEKDYAPLFDDYKYGTTIWSPLASGVLTGKYNNGIPEGSRFATSPELSSILKKWLGDDVKEKNIKKLNDLKVIADELGATLAQLAIAWTLKNNDVSTCILGATSIEQLQQNIGSLDVVPKITPEVEAKIEAILGNAPEQETNFLTWKPLPGRRQ